MFRCGARLPRETTARRGAVRKGGWFEHPGVAAVKQSRRLSL
ncbi:hypothetical protein HMPREF1318_1279 [Actinomyces massiliensis F0489]|uniref:Uncharacterized protein n=1 Tax=Actinomyces massiliensis F0489 TaxID=1125718 RepID=J1GRU1_9ACTO|nr:hypothetical protein HMPREF1318_1279 [Actinomyces massiliensis F0489]